MTSNGILFQRYNTLICKYGLEYELILSIRLTCWYGHSSILTDGALLKEYELKEFSRKYYLSEV